MALGHAIKKARTLRGLSQTELQETCGVDAATISIMERRDSKRSIHATAIAAALNVSLPALMSGEVVPLPDVDTKNPAQAIRDEAALDGYALIEQGLRALVVVGKAKDAILTQVRDAAEESKLYQDIAFAKFRAEQRRK